MNELREAIVSWCKYENIKRYNKFDAVTTGNETETHEGISIVPDEGFIFQDPEGVDYEKHNLR